MKTNVKFKIDSKKMTKAIDKAIRNSDFNVNCPNCLSSIQAHGSQIGGQLICPFCHTQIILEDSLNDGLRSIQKNIDKRFK